MLALETLTTTLALNARLGEYSAELQLRNSALTEALARYDDLADGLTAVLEVGAVALRATSVGLDVQSLRAELDLAIERATVVVASLGRQVSSIAADNGPLALMIQSASADAIAELRRALASQGNSDLPDSLAGRVAASLQSRLSDALAQWQSTSRHQAEAIQSAIRSIREPDGNTPLDQRLQRIERSILDLNGAVMAAKARADEHELGTLKGLEYEDLIARITARVAAVHQDVFQYTGKTPGQLVVQRRPSLKASLTS